MKPGTACWLTMLVCLPALAAGGDVQADLLDVLYRQTGAEQKLPDASWGDYLGMLALKLHSWIAERIAAALPFSVVWAWWAAWALIAILLLVLGLRVVRLIRGRGAGVLAPGRAGEPPASPAPSTPLSAQQWRAAIDRRLSEGHLDAALQAVWWWWARTLMGANSDPTWTTRELLAAARREELRPEAVLLDSMRYGAAPPTPADILVLVARLEAALA